MIDSDIQPDFQATIVRLFKSLDTRIEELEQVKRRDIEAERWESVAGFDSEQKALRDTKDILTALIVEPRDLVPEALRTCISCGKVQSSPESPIPFLCETCYLGRVKMPAEQRRSKIYDFVRSGGKDGRLWGEIAECLKTDSYHPNPNTVNFDLTRLRLAGKIALGEDKKWRAVT